ncbi:YjhG/YagF family D-xylonate dehydratase [Arenibacter palladensis]|uniref:YjhG/YagF family D-xylonate dehydratase n=1 Tax=Arenibacter palladensis TaxID=237373 RepID=UPI0026E25270|nr:YjhG/YagF family D-xylonate dehydratase [Arenibacter palladensis]MDO6602634.1 YjhG/YagF family D-xylonate dehydratase [Arenibacter palladensis]
MSNNDKEHFQENSPFYFPLEVTPRKGLLPISREDYENKPSGDIFGKIQDAGMKWNPDDVNQSEFLIMSTAGGLKNGEETLALGMHSGHFELGDAAKVAANAFKNLFTKPYYVSVSDPCDGRTQGTTGMMNSLAYRNHAATVLGDLRRSLPNRKGVMGIATCDKGLPAMMMALANESNLPTIIMPGGVTLIAKGIKDLGSVQSLPSLVSHKEISLQEAQSHGCASCGTPGGGCHFLGTAATSQVVAEALGMALPHSALAPSGGKIWYALAKDSAIALVHLANNNIYTSQILTQDAVYNAMVVHAAFGGSTNLLLHIPAIAHAAGLPMPSRKEWEDINRKTPRLVNVLPAGKYSTAHVYAAGGVPEVMLHLRKLGLLKEDCLTVTGKTLGENLDVWEQGGKMFSWEAENKRDRRQQVRFNLQTFNPDAHPDKVILSPEAAKKADMKSTLTFPTGNLAPEGSLIKSGAIAPEMIDDNGIYYKKGVAKVFVSEANAIKAINHGEVKPGHIIILMGTGPSGTGMEETFQITGALKQLSFGKEIALITDGRFSGVSTGACIGHVGPEALVGGPIGKVQDGDVIEIKIDCDNLSGSINLIASHSDPDAELSEAEIAQLFSSRLPHPELRPHPELPNDIKIWAATQSGIWEGCVQDADRILKIVKAGIDALK